MNNDARLEAAIAEFLQAAEAGQSPDRDALARRYPDLAEELHSFFADHDQMLRGVRGETPPPELPKPSPCAIDPTLPLEGASASLPPAARGEAIRYFGDYELLEEVARGGMGVVWRARQTSLNRIVALKMILAGQLAGAEDVRRFQAEAEAAAKLDHPNIVPIYEVGEHAGQHFFSMGFVAGESLADRVARGPLPPEDAARIVRTVAQAVQYAHERGVVHRDLKPANVLLEWRETAQPAGTEKGDPKSAPQQPSETRRDGPRHGAALVPRLTDFGLAKRIDDRQGYTATGQILGTPAYMPPEQAAGETREVGPHSDVYSLGAILYCLLVGRPPFQAATPMETLLQVLEREPPPPRRINPAVPRDLETICLKCLEKSPADRYASAVVLAEDVRRYLDDEPIEARPTSLAETVVRAVRKRRRSVAVVLLAALVTAATVVFGLWLWAWRQEASLAHISIATTDDAAYTAEILDEDGQPVVAKFTAPTEEPVAVPAGDWQVAAFGSPAAERDVAFRGGGGRDGELPDRTGRAQVLAAGRSRARISHCGGR